MPTFSPRCFLPWSLLLVLAWAAGAPARAAGSDDPVLLGLENRGPQTVSDAERYASQLVLRFFEEGPRSWWPELSSSSPLRELEESEALAEIAVRLGSAEGAEWILLTPERERDREVALFAVHYTSGADDLLEIEMVREDDRLRVHRLRCLADPRAITLPVGREIADALSVPPVKTAPAAPAVLLGALLLCLLCLLFPILRSPHARRRRLALLCAAGVLALGCDRAKLQDALGDLEVPWAATDAENADTVDPDLLHSLAPLQPLRLALTSSRSMDDDAIDGLMDQLETELGDTGRRAASAWLAQRLVSLGRLQQARELLDELPAPSQLPVVELLRARVAWIQGRSKAVFSAYEEALTRAPYQDLLRLEAASAYIMNGDDLRAEAIFEQLIRNGSRFAEVYYFGSRFATLAERHQEADELFVVGWHLEPVSRSELFSDPLLSYSATRPSVFQLFDFSSVDEPVVRPRRLASRELDYSVGSFETRLLGNLLTITRTASGPASDDSADRRKTLILPDGAALAPIHTAVESAEVSRRRERDHALAQLEPLIAQASLQGGLAHPARQRLARTAAVALAESNRWRELLELTQAVTDDPRGMPPDLIKLRARALMEEDQEIEATNLLIELAKADLENKRRDPGTYYQLAEMFAQAEQYDLALRLLRKADKLSPQRINPGRVKQIELDRELSSQYIYRETEHFRLLYPELTGSTYPKHLGWVLEAEWRRLQKWIPARLDPGERIEIHLIPLQQFMDAYSGGVTVVGIYDGRVRVPLADLRSLDPVLVGIVSHELAHAMIDIHTEGKAPKWLHEGLAGHIEMEQPGINPIPDMHRAGRDLTFSIIEPVLAGFSEPQLVELAYSHANWAMHYVESRWGVRGIHKLLDAFRRGDDTEGAIRRAFGQSIREFDAGWRDWCLNKAPETWPTQLIHYERAFDDILDMGGNDGLSDAELASLTESRGGSGSTFTAPPKARPSGPSLKQQVRAWHGTYKAKVLPAKQRLRSALAILKGKKQGNLKAECTALGQALRVVQEDPVALKSPSPKARKHLEQAYGHFLTVAVACLKGQNARVQTELGHASRALDQAGKELKPYDVRP